jgi:hypothetical protein
LGCSKTTFVVKVAALSVLEAVGVTDTVPTLALVSTSETFVFSIFVI